MSDVVPVEAGQWRQYGFGHAVYAVLRPHPRRKGFWLCVSDQDAGTLFAEVIGRRELESMKLVSKDHYGKRGHPGENSAKAIESGMVTRGIR